MPEHNFGGQVRTLIDADGHGYVCLLAHDTDRHAMLMESLDQPFNEVDVSPEDKIATLCSILRQAWRRPTPLLVPSPEPMRSAAFLSPS